MTPATTPYDPDRWAEQAFYARNWQRDSWEEHERVVRDISGIIVCSTPEEADALRSIAANQGGCNL